MGVEEICNTGLTLGLGSLESTTTPKNQLDQLDHHQHNKKYSSSKLSDRLFPSLSLALSSEVLTNQGAPIIDISGKVVEGEAANNLKRQASSLSVVSSFSNSTSVKRERDIINVVSGEEDVEVEKVVVYSSKHDEDQDDQEYFGARKKLRLSKDQSLVLEESFKEHSTLNPKQKQALAKRLNLQPRQVEVWFQNRRARTKLKQTEVECEMLKKCCETLTEENRRLKKEVQDLKAFKSTTPTAAPFYMQLSAATITLCPSCQRITGTTTNTNTNTTSTVTESSSKSPLSSKPQFYATIAHSSAPSYSSTLQTG